MKAQVKVLNGTKWVPVGIDLIAEPGVLGLMQTTKDRMVAALFNNDSDKPILFLCTHFQDQVVYQEKGLCLMVDELSILTMAGLISGKVVKVFPDGKFEQIITK